MLFPERICKLVTIYPSSEKITPEPFHFYLMSMIVYC